MQQGPLLQGKRAPPFKTACAIVWGLWIAGTFGMGLSVLHNRHQVTLGRHASAGGAHHEILLHTLAFPLSAMLLLVMLIPLFGAQPTARPHLPQSPASD